MMTESKVIGIDVCDMIHIDEVINEYCYTNGRKLLNVNFFESEGYKYMLLITEDRPVSKAHDYYTALGSPKQKDEVEWLSEDPILLKGEIAIAKDRKSYGLVYLKIGDGQRRYSELPYMWIE